MRDARIDFTLANPNPRSPFLTYEPYYGLKEKAFSLSAEPRFLYKSRTHAPLFDELRAGIRRREGIIVLTGEPGTGKTTLCRSVLEALDRKTFCTYVPDPFVSREDLLKMLLIDFGVMSVDDLKSGRLHSASRLELGYPLFEFLRSLVPLQAYAVLIIDEAQNLASQLLEEIRILSDLEGPEKLLQLVLVGQPELREKLKDPSMRQVDQRVSVRCSLQTLDRDTLPGYLAHRLTVAGAGFDRVEFAPAALDLVYGSSKGNPRVINLIADRSLNRGHQERTWIITPAIVEAALEDLGYEKPPVVVREGIASPPLAPEIVLPALPPLALVPAIPAIPAEPAQARPAAVEAAPVEIVVTDIDQGDSVPEDFFLPESPQPDVQEPERPSTVTNVRPHELRAQRRWRRAVMLLAAGLALAVMGMAINEWDVVRQELSQPIGLPVLPAAPKQSVSAGAAPVIYPPEFFAPVTP